MSGVCVCLRRGQFGSTARDKYGELPQPDKRRLYWRCKEHRKVDDIDKNELQQYQKKAIAGTLPGFSSWLNKHGLMQKAPLHMTADEIMAMLGKFLEMYEREMGRQLDKAGNSGILEDDEIPY